MSSIELVALLQHVLRLNTLTEDKIIALESQISQIEKVDNLLLENLILPRLLPILDQAGTLAKEESKAINVLHFMRILLNKSILDNETAFKTMIIVLMSKIYDPSSNQPVNVSEQLHSAVLDCLETLFRRISSSVAESFYVKANVMRICQLVYVCSKAIESQKALEVRVSGIRCLISVCGVHDDSDLNDVVLRDQISRLIFNMLPKTIAVLRDVIGSDVQQTLIQLAVKAFGRINCLTMEDETHETEETNLLELATLLSGNEVENLEKDVLGMKLKDPESRRKYLETVEKTPEWIRAAAVKLKPAILSLRTVLRPQVSSDVKDELLSITILLFSRCQENLRLIHPFLLEVLLIYSVDQVEKRSSNAKEALSSLQPSINETTRELFLTHLKRLPRIINRSDENELCVALTLLKGFVFHNETQTLLNESTFLDPLLDFLILAHEIELPFAAFDQNEVLELDTTSVEWKIPPWRRLRHVTEDENQNLLQEIVAELSKRPSIRELIFAELENNVNVSNELLLMLIAVFRCRADVEDELIAACLEEFVQDRHFRLAIERSTSGDDTSRHELQFNLIHTCLVMEFLSLLAWKIRESEKCGFSFRILPFLMEKIGLNNRLIHLAGVESLENMAKAFGHADVSTFIEENSDFLAHHIASSLKRNNLDHSLSMTNAFLQFQKSFNDLKFIDDILKTVLELLSNHRKARHVTSSLKIILLLLRNMEKQLSRAPKPSEVLSLTAEAICGDLEASLNAEPEPEEPFESFDTDRQLDPEEVPEEEPEPDQEPAPPSDSEDAALLKAILRTVINYISVADFAQKLFAMEIAGIGLKLLREDRQLLEFVHLVWVPLSGRFKEKNLVVVNRTFEILLILAELSKSFIQKRTTKEVFPFILETLREVKSDKSDLDDIKSSTQKFKLLCAILLNVGRLVTDLEIHEKEFDDILDVCLLYLSDRQPKELQVGAKELLRHLFLYDSPAVAVKLRRLKH